MKQQRINIDAETTKLNANAPCLVKGLLWYALQLQTKTRYQHLTRGGHKKLYKQLNQFFAKAFD